MNLSWLHKLNKIAPAILCLTPLAPIAPLVSAVIAAVETIPDATGPEKKKAALDIISNTIQTINTVKHKEVINKDLAINTANVAIDTVVEAVNLVHKNVP